MHLRLERYRLLYLGLLISGIVMLWSQRNAVARIIHWQRGLREKAPRNVRTHASPVQRVNMQYGNKVDALASDAGLPASYLKALIVLECSGMDPVPSRFEPHVYRELQALRDRRIRRYGGLKRKHVKDASNAALRNLATSWGPFQLMGYHCVQMGVEVHDLRGDSALYWGIRWIDRTYGKRLRKGQFQDAFHIHNTGRPHPRSGASRTHDPAYCSKGLAYIQRFERGS